MSIPPEIDVTSSQSGEAGQVWLWAWPELIKWKAEITWLFSPPTGSQWKIGDLWGIDASGDLLIVECKRVPGSGKEKDPFRNFPAHVPPFEKIHRHWDVLRKAEKAFIENHLQDLQKGQPLFGTYDGITPYSKHRFEVQRWRHLYVDLIAPFIASDKYRDSVEANLRCYVNRNSPRPYYAALFTIFDSGAGVLTSQRLLSSKGEAKYRELIKPENAGPNHVNMFAVRQNPSGLVKSCQIESYAIEAR